MSKCCTFRQKKILVCVNIPGNKTVSDSDSDLFADAFSLPCVTPQFWSVIVLFFFSPGCFVDLLHP